MNNGDTLFNWIQSANSDHRSTTAGLLANGLVMPALLLLLVFIVAISALPTTVHASTEFPTQDLETPSEFEMHHLHRIFNGFVAVEFPSDRVSRCLVKTASPFQRRWKEFFRSWFSVVVEAQCPGLEAVRDIIWIECVQRSEQLDCKLSVPSDAIQAVINAAVPQR